MMSLGNREDGQLQRSEARRPVGLRCRMYHEELVKARKLLCRGISRRIGSIRSLSIREAAFILEVMMNKKQKISLIAAAVLIVIAAVLLIVSHNNQPVTVEGAKTITVAIIPDAEHEKNYTIHTDEDFLRGALEQEGLIEGTESEYGLYVTRVDGIAADESLRQWWCFNDGEGNMLMTGVDTTPIADGDTFQIVLSVY